MPDNQALWLNAKRAPFTVGPAPYTAPRADEIVVRARAVAVNPMDRLQQTLGDIFTPWMAYPFVVGSDVAGEVVEVGSGVTRFQRRRPRGRLRRRLGQAAQSRRRGRLPGLCRPARPHGAPIPDAHAVRGRGRPAARAFDRGVRPVPERLSGDERAVSNT